MATAKKVPAKKVPAKKAVAKKAPAKRIVASQRTIASAKADEMFAMPQEVKDWIDRASSTMKHQANQIAELKDENAKLKAYKRFAENRILGTSHE